VVLADESAGPSGQGAPVQVDDLRPPPEDWRPYQARTNRLEGAGLGLVGLRKPAFVGRESERDLLWNAYRRAVDDKGLQVVLLSGEAGIGKTHLAEWLVTFAHEMASARVLRLGDFSRASEGLEDTLRTWMMPQEHVYGHLLRTLPPLEGGDRSREYDARALTSILRPSTSNRSEGDWFIFSSKREKLVVLERLVRRLASRRPTIVSIDDLHAALPALDFVEHLIAGGRLTNVLVIATVRSDLVEETPELQDRFERLADAEVVSRVELGPMSQTERRQLARQLTSSDSVTELLVERMEGNPLFGVQLLTDWVERDLMRADSDGTTVLPEALEDLPADIHAVWLERIQRLEARVGDPGQFRRSLELAAVLGQNVSREDWSALCEADETIRRDLWDRLLERGLARRTEGGWRFAHGLLVTSLHRLARESGRWSEHHRRCAETLQGVFRREPFRVARRLADHWIEAGRPERALAPLLEEAERLRRSDAPRAGREVLLLRARLLDELGVPSDDLQRVRNDLDVLRHTLRTDGAPGKVHDEAMAILERISSRDAPELQCRIWRTIAHCKEGVGDTEASLRAAARAVEAAQESGNQRELAMAMLGYARGHLWFGREDGARRLADEVAELAESMGDQHIAMRASALAAWAAFNGEQLDVAEELFHNGLEQARAIGARSIEADALNGLGEVARLRGKSSEAATHYRGAISVYREMQQLDDEAIASMNLAVAEIQGRHFDRARPRIDESARRLQQLGYDFINSHIELARLAIAAGQSDWPEFDRALGELEETAEAGGLRLTRDFIWKAELARDLVDPDAVDRRARIEAFVAALAEELRRSREARE
jgi:tetratricopeptide (TPR) repeat protein